MLTRIRKLIVTALLFAAAPVSAQMFDMPIGPPPDGPGRGGPGMFLPLLMRQSDLSPEQQADLRKILEADRATLKDLFSDLDAANSALADKLLAPGDVNAATLAPLVQRVAQLRQQLMEQGVKSALAMRKVLTPEQLARAAARKKRMQELHAEMRKLVGE